MHRGNVNSTTLSDNYINVSYIHYMVILYYTTHGSEVEAGGPSDVADSWPRCKGLFL
jgi:hypothetical protein